MWSRGLLNGLSNLSKAGSWGVTHEAASKIAAIEITIGMIANKQPK